MVKRLLTTFVLTFLFIASAVPTSAQIVVDVGNISGSQGETVFVPVNLTSVPASGFTSFQFDVTLSNSNLTFNGHLSTGTLTTNGSGWGVGSNSSDAGTNPGRVGGYASDADAINVDGALVLLSFTINGTDGGGQVTLVNTRFAKGATVAHTPEIPSTQLIISNPPVAADDSYSVDEGGTLSVSAAQGVLANDTDADGDPLTVTVQTDVSNGSLTLNADGSFEYTHNGSETTTDSFVYTVSDGSNSDTGTATISVNPVNDPPVFTSTMPSMGVDEGELIVFDYDATDADGDVLTYSIVSGPGALEPTGGVYSWTATPSGSYAVTVAVSDGTVTVNAPVATISVRQIDQYQTTLTGLHLPTVIVTEAEAAIQVDHNVTDDLLVVTGSFSGLSSSFASAQLGVGSPSEEGTAVLSLLAGFTDPTFRSGSFSEASNTIDLNTVSFPAGFDAATFKTALADGNVFVMIRTLDNLGGEIRGQLRTNDNTAPSTVSVVVPTDVNTTGDPNATLLTVSWSGAPSDAESDEVKLVLEVGSDAAFNDVLEVLDVSVTTGSAVSFNTDWVASLYDRITGREPGNILVGGTAMAYFRLTSTDGNRFASGAGQSLTITRSSVTDTEDESVPSDFVLRGNYPNPFNPSTTISFDLPEPAEVQVDVLDLLGRTMISVPMQNMSAGANHSIPVDAGELTSGIYMYRVIARGSSQTWVRSGTMTLIK